MKAHSDSGFELKAARRGVTYNRVMYWVNKSDYHPYKAEFFTVSNRLLKRCYYRKFKDMGGAVRPTQLVMEDTLRQGERCDGLRRYEASQPPR